MLQDTNNATFPSGKTGQELASVGIPKKEES